MLDNLEEIAGNVRKVLETKYRAREELLSKSRLLTRHCANAIRAMHRQEWDEAQMLLGTAREVLDQMSQSVQSYPDLLYAGYTQDSFKEYVEAAVVFSIVRGQLLPTPQELRVEEATYLNGMAEAASELRRYILDIIRHEHTEEAERLLTAMDSIYDLLVTFDFPEALTGGPRHPTDTGRGRLAPTSGRTAPSLPPPGLPPALAPAEKLHKPPPLNTP